MPLAMGGTGHVSKWAPLSSLPLPHRLPGYRIDTELRCILEAGFLANTTGPLRHADQSFSMGLSFNVSFAAQRHACLIGNVGYISRRSGVLHGDPPVVRSVRQRGHASD